jgi:type II secretory ATPase GspE/PulE/Tfp pilus assembly ATPase PilB-like protein
MSLELLEKELARAGGPSIITAVNLLIADACARRASDIHLDPARDGLRVRLRIDGVLCDAFSFPPSVRAEIIARIKVLAGMRGDEHQTAQDGRIRHALGAGRVIDIRVAIAPTYRGENAVLRLLAASDSPLTLDSLGFSDADQKKIATALKKTNGMMLVTGPTGSGKTTTLYALMRMLDAKTSSLVTIEDPVEYEMDDVTQIVARERAGLTFANGLRAILRQDPDAVMVGEIRDAETAAIAVNTALTGHLLLSTLHTSDAATTLPRLLDMKIEAFLLASTITLVIAQRLVRKICADCATTYAISAEMAKAFVTTPFARPPQLGETLHRGCGCDACGGSGYAGRVGICEVLVADRRVREAILRRMPADELRRLAVANGMTTMAEDGLSKARAGLTTIEEVLRVIHD